MSKRPPRRSSASPPGRRGTEKPGATHEQTDRRARFERAQRESLKPSDPDVAVLYGWHTVATALKNPARRFRKLLVTENAARKLAEDGLELPVQAEIVRPDAIAARLPPDAVHQGLYAEADALRAPPIEEIGPESVLLVLDQVTDPHNVGAIMRCSAAFNATAVVTTIRHSPDVTGVLAKSASGALEHVPLIAVQNLGRAIAGLKERGVLIVGLDADGESELSEVALRTPLALVLGAEGRGLRQSTREACDAVARLDLPGAIKSLNVSTATAVALHIVVRKLAGR